MPIPMRGASRLAAPTLAFLFIASAVSCSAQVSTGGFGVGNWLTFTANIPEGGFRQTQFFDPHYNTRVLEWDSRIELWLPPSRDIFAWGLYVRLAGIVGSRNDAFQNAWLGEPGVGFQTYPFSSWRFRQPKSNVGRLLGPLRLFAEYNHVDYWGAENVWRPHRQIRIGFEHWKAVNVNEPTRAWWLETWNGVYWQSSNEFTDQYDAVIVASSLRSGIRKTKSGAISTITPYLAIQSSHTKYDYGGTQSCFLGVGSCDFYWENGLQVGGGIRFAPSLAKLEHNHRVWLNRFVVYGEYLNTATYYGPTAPSSVPRFDIIVGVSGSIGQWYK